MKKKDYLYTGLISFGILAFIFIIKGIFPFGNNSVLIGDLHDQITPFYYHLHDAFYSNKSLLVDYSTSGGINFIGILAYYIISPFSVLALLVPRENIYLIMPIIVALKIVACSITCLYFIKKYFKNIPPMLQGLLAITYAFSGYGLIMYQITSWIDAMYMFPLLIIGLKKVLDYEKPTFYIVTLTLSLIFSFYVTIMTMMLVFLGSLVYLYVYKEKEDRKKIITSLGISTLLSILIALFIIIPSYIEISESSRIGFKLASLLNSKTGPLSDKLSMIAFGGIVYLGLIILFMVRKNNKKFLTFYIPTLLIMLIPLLIEPVNKVLHFGTYASFPYRNGFILMFLMILGACYGFNNYEERKDEGFEINKYASVFTVIVACFILFKFSLRYYTRFQNAIFRLSISFDSKLIIVLLATTFLATLTALIILLLNKKLNKFTTILLAIITLTHITINTYIYVANDKNQNELTSQYKLLNDVSKEYKNKDYFRIKNNLEGLVTNNGMVMKFNTLEHFTSLTNKNNLSSIKKLGYSSEWVKTRSSGSNLLIDYVMGNRYILTDEKINSPYYHQIVQYPDARLYELKSNSTFGILLNKNDTLKDKNNSFEVANSLYKNVMNTDDDIFTIDNIFINDNIKGTKLENDLVNYEIVDDEYYAYFEKDIIITGKKNLYIEMVHSPDNDQNFRINNAFNLYINNKLVKEDAFTEPKNGVLDLGIYENKRVNIKFELKKSVILKEIVVGLMDTEKYENFVETSYMNNDINFNKNKVTLKINNPTNEKKILFIPIVNDGNYKATLNGKGVNILKLYDNYIGIEVNPGDNVIKLTYIPRLLIPTLIISIFALIITIVLIKTNLYFKLTEINILQNISYYIYLFIYIGFITIAYVLMILCFLISYVKFINI